MRLRITTFGTSAEGIRLTGDPRKPEPDHVRIAFPGGHVEVVRATDGVPNPPYWVHVYVNNERASGYDPCDHTAKIVDARLDQSDKHASEMNVGDFNRPQLYHLAVKIDPTGEPKA